MNEYAKYETIYNDDNDDNDDDDDDDMIMNTLFECDNYNKKKNTKIYFKEEI